MVYTRTAFLSATGNDGTAVLNDPNHPYLTTAAALTALNVAYSGLDTTLRLRNTVNGGNATVPAGLINGLTIMGHDAAYGLGDIVTFDNNNAALTLDWTTIANLQWTANSAGSVTGGTITAGAHVATITNLQARGAAGSTGGTGAAGGTHTGAAGSAGADGDPPTAGGTGGDTNSNGGTGVGGSTGGSGRNLTAAGSLTIDSCNLSGASAGDGGAGGNAGTATGGEGGAGGDSTAIIDQDGGNGGDGGAAIANGGLGGTGGNGGDGGNLTLTGGAICTTFVSDAGFGGVGGAGGSAGTANGGTGGAGGAPALLGNPGTPGNPGSESTDPGLMGDAGTDGSPGSIL